MSPLQLAYLINQERLRILVINDDYCIPLFMFLIKYSLTTLNTGFHHLKISYRLKNHFYRLDLKRSPNEAGREERATSVIFYINQVSFDNLHNTLNPTMILFSPKVNVRQSETCISLFVCAADKSSVGNFDAFVW